MSQNFLPVRNYKGTRDFYPEDMLFRNWYFSKVRNAVESFGYEEYHGPLLESFDVYAAKSGEEVVNEQLYSFEDKKNRRLVIRPEMTPTVARMVAAKLEQMTFPLRWFSIANFMRYEQPQKGRLREHWQVNVDAFGSNNIHGELEILSIINAIMMEFGAPRISFKIKINNRKFFNDVLTHILKVKDENVRMVAKAVDRRAKISREAYDSWLGELGLAQEKVELLDRIFSSSLDEIIAMFDAPSEGAEELSSLFDLIKKAGLGDICEFDFAIIRGFDYYTGTVFEVYDTSPENRRSLFGGGRYDNLVNLFKKANVSGIGFGLGDVTFQNFLETHELVPENLITKKRVLITRFKEVAYEEYFKLSDKLRQGGIANSIYIEDNFKLGKQIAFAEKKAFDGVIVMGEDELKKGEVTFKHLARKSQDILPIDTLAEKLKELLG
ncbi:MAG: histidine--tRNA ligase [Spirochaetales bacterium]|nr:histidine--tRNA ligase [Spirochaetales bacterium]